MESKYDSALKELQKTFKKTHNKEVQEALSVNGGDLEKAIAYLRKKGEEAKIKPSEHLEEHIELVPPSERKKIAEKEKKRTAKEAKKEKQAKQALRKRSYSMFNSGMGIDFLSSEMKPEPIVTRRRAYSMEEPARTSDVAAPVKVRRAGTLVQKLTRSFSSLFRKKSTKPSDSQPRRTQVPGI